MCRRPAVRGRTKLNAARRQRPGRRRRSARDGDGARRRAATARRSAWERRRCGRSDGAALGEETARADSGRVAGDGAALGEVMGEGMATAQLCARGWRRHAERKEDGGYYPWELAGTAGVFFA